MLSQTEKEKEMPPNAPVLEPPVVASAGRPVRALPQLPPWWGTPPKHAHGARPDELRWKWPSGLPPTRRHTAHETGNQCPKHHGDEPGACFHAWACIIWPPFTPSWLWLAGRHHAWLALLGSAALARCPHASGALLASLAFCWRT